MTPETAPVPRETDSAASRIVALADACVLCGLCLPHCPTYTLDRVEGESPRGRIMLFKGLAEGRLSPEPAATAHLDHCLGCRHCERVCPAQVRYGDLLLAGRAALRERVPARWKQRLVEGLLPRRGALRLALRLGTWLGRAFPGPWRRLPPTPPGASFAPQYPARGARRGSVGLFLGCLGPHYDAAAARAAIALLTRLGWDVTLPPAQTCCGAAHRHAGNEAGAARLDAINRAAFAGEVAAVLTLASGCHESVAQAFGGEVPVREALVFIARDERLATLRLRPAAPGTRVALQLPCTQRNVTRGAASVGPLLAHLPGLEITPLPDAGCCGAAGAHMLTEPARADALRAPWLDAIARTSAATLCSANVGCRLHLAVGLGDRGLAVATRHPLELLADHLDDSA